MLDSLALLKPMLAQAGLTILITFWLAWARVGSIARGKVNLKDVATKGWQGWIKNAGDNYTNQYEMPLLFFVLCFIAISADIVTPFIVGLAWGYVVSRYIHALVHLTVNIVFLRFFVFFFGGILLTIMFFNIASHVFSL